MKKFSELNEEKGFPLTVKYKGNSYTGPDGFGKHTETGKKVGRYLADKKTAVPDRVWATQDGKVFPDSK